MAGHMVHSVRSRLSVLGETTDESLLSRLVLLLGLDMIKGFIFLGMITNYISVGNAPILPNLGTALNPLGVHKTQDRGER